MQPTLELTVKDFRAAKLHVNGAGYEQITPQLCPPDDAPRAPSKRVRTASVASDGPKLRRLTHALRTQRQSQAILVPDSRGIINAQTTYSKTARGPVAKNASAHASRTIVGSTSK